MQPAQKLGRTDSNSSGSRRKTAEIGIRRPSGVRCQNRTRAAAHLPWLKNRSPTSADTILTFAGTEYYFTRIVQANPDRRPA